MSHILIYILTATVLMAMYNTLLPVQIQWRRPEQKARLIATALNIVACFTICFAITDDTGQIGYAVVVSTVLYCVSERFIKKSATCLRNKTANKLLQQFESTEDSDQRKNIKAQLKALRRERQLLARRNKHIGI